MITNLLFHLIANGYDSRSQSLNRTLLSLREERDRFLFGCFTALYKNHNRRDAE